MNPVSIIAGEIYRPRYRDTHRRFEVVEVKPLKPDRFVKVKNLQTGRTTTISLASFGENRYVRVT